jgi:hypothetical protein
VSESKELTLPERAAVALGTPKYEQEIRDLVAKSVTITEVKNKDGREQCHGAMMTLRTARVAIEKAAKGAREDATAFSKAVIAEEKRLVALAAPEESRLQILRDAWDAEVEREKQAKAAAEKARVDGIKTRIERFMLDAMTVSDQTSSAIDAHATKLSETVISLDEYMEFSGEAQMKRDDTVKWLRERQRQAAEREAEAARLAAEREALERQRAEEAARLAAERAELDRLRAEQEERERVAAAARERAAAAMRAEQEAHEQRMTAEREAANAAWLAQHEVEQASLRAQQEAADKLAAATSEIQGIQQQVIIAQMGRAGVRKGGTIECIRDTLAETEAWEIDDRFGILRGAAESAKSTAVAEIRRLLTEAEARIATEAAQKLESDHAEALIENARIDAERLAAFEAQQQEVQRCTDEQERIRREQVQFIINGPGDVEIVKVIAEHYNVEIGDAMEWMKKFDYAAADEYFAAANVAANRMEQAA